MEERLAKGPVDLPFLMLVLMLVGIGMIMVFSASYATAYYDEDISSPYYFAQRHALFVVSGILILYLVSRINYQFWRGLSIPILAVAFVLLTLVITPLGVTVNNAQRWMKLALVAGPLFQPSEIAKLAVILFFSARLAKRDSQQKKKWNRRTNLGRFLEFLDRIGLLELVPYGVILVAMAGLMLKEPHLSGTILIFIGGAAVLFAAGVGLHWFFLGGGAAVVGMWFIVTMTPYMTSRITLWQDPWSDPQDKGFQTIQSIYAIASGGLTGLGLGKSRQKFLYLPEPENDFIFSIVVEELGLVGAIIVIVLFALLIIRGYWLAIHARDRFGSLVVVGITTLLAFQVFLNIGVVTNFIPNTGISLPFFSYGGTALWIHLAEMGIILAVSRQIPSPKQE
jgi:cell division protein FtsW